MKPVWAHRDTKCNSCKKIIPPGSRRLDDMVRRGKTGGIHLHYHIACFTKYIDGWFELNPYTIKSGSGGRPKLDLSEEQRTERRKILNSLHALKKYYLPKLNFSGDVTKLNLIDLRRFQRFHQRRKELIERLIDVGGIPEQYQHTEAPRLLAPSPASMGQTSATLSADTSL